MLLSLIVIFLNVAACQPAESESSDLQIELSISPDPPQVGQETTIELTLTDSARKNFTEAIVTLEATMTHPGMQPLTKTAREITPGKYLAPFEFTMAGSWVIIVRSELSDGRVIEKTLELPAVRSN